MMSVIKGCWETGTTQNVQRRVKGSTRRRHIHSVGCASSIKKGRAGLLLPHAVGRLTLDKPSTVSNQKAFPNPVSKQMNKGRNE